ncbi:uncharacterized protein DUF5011 [Salsuginibacillus halophilus]|uniref:Uncharacterized protein DUF5011 n=1 Tax=Salsuginibacillus halophilus TaxID=517424 RepID=A0A2P8HQD2_9BACI|nr:immunoglobulin-like domain-containing protein [Salsuginibacillus halophilus]PSL48431.1 uncharacterized protein DUF5011 [Salsuginibacillus halophilus]
MPRWMALLIISFSFAITFAPISVFSENGNGSNGDNGDEVELEVDEKDTFQVTFQDDEGLNCDEINIYKGDEAEGDPLELGPVDNGSCTFQGLAPGEYTAEYISSDNGEEETDDTTFEIENPVLDLEVNEEHSGEGNDEGEITVSLEGDNDNEDFTDGADIVLYRSQTSDGEREVQESQTIDEDEDVDEITFDDLGAGHYTAVKELHDVESEPSDEEVVEDGEQPDFSITGDDPLEVVAGSWSTDELNDGVELEYNIEDPVTNFSELDGELDYRTWDGGKIEVEDNGDTWSSDNGLNDLETRAGKYTVTYYVKENGDNDYEELGERELTVAPPAPSIVNEYDTWEAADELGKDGQERFDYEYGALHIDRGDLENELDVDDLTITYSGGTVNNFENREDGQLLLYDLPLGDGYTITQTVNNVTSAASAPAVSLEDTTWPYFQFDGDGVYGEEGDNDTDDEELDEFLEIVEGDNLTDADIRADITARDNVDGSLTGAIEYDRSDVDTDSAGLYTLTYAVADSAGNEQTLRRDVHVRPPAPRAIGSPAEIGTVDAVEGMPGLEVHLFEQGIDDAQEEETFPDNEDTFTFLPLDDEGERDRLEPGVYFVRQVLEDGGETLESPRSNLVEVEETESPVIELEGDANVEVTFSDEDPYKYDDPGAVATDYLYGDLRELLHDDSDEDSSVELTLESSIGDEVTQSNDDSSDKYFEDVFGFSEGNDETEDEKLELPAPGAYSITYNASVRSGNDATPVTRNIEARPPQLEDVEAGDAGDGEIDVNDIHVYDGYTTTVRLLDNHGELVEEADVSNGSSADEDHTFTGVPAAGGYQVVQEVNGQESAPSEAVDVRLRDKPLEFTSFRLITEDGVSVPGQLDHDEGDIHAVVPADTFSTNHGDEDFTVEFSTSSRVENVEQGNNIESGDEVSLGRSGETFTLEDADGDDKTYTLNIEEAEHAVSPGFSGAVISETDAGDGALFDGTNAGFMSAAANSGAVHATEDWQLYIPGRAVPGISDPAVQQHNRLSSALDGWSNLTVPDWAHSSETNEVFDIHTGQGGVLAEPFVFATEEDGTSFVRVVETDDGIHGYAQPSTTSTLQGAIHQSGTYAVLEDIDTPAAPEASAANETTFELTGDSGADIYYTTDSTAVDYVAGAENTAGLTLRGESVADSAWSLYDEPVELDAGERLYAVQEVDGLFSFVESVHIPSGYTASEENISETHTWTVDFSTEVDENYVRAPYFTVTEAETGEEVDVNLSTTDDGAGVHIATSTPYQSGSTYEMTIHPDVKAANGRSLTGGGEVTFTIE